MNLYYSSCGGNTPGWNALVNIERNAYDAVKAINASSIVFPSFQLEALYGNSITGFDATQYNAMANLKRDRFGISTYPAAVAANPYQLPADYLSRVKDRNPQEQRAVLAETGWNSSNLAVYYNSACIASLAPSDPSYSAAFLLHVLYFSYVNNFEIVTWWSGRDLVDAAKVMGTCYPPVPPGSSTCAGDPWCLSVAQFQVDYAAYWLPPQSEIAYKAFGSMGLKSYAGVPRADMMYWWNIFRAMTVRP